MKNAKTNFAFAALGCVLGVLASCLFLGDETPAPKPVEKEVSRPKRAAVADVPGATERALRRRVAQLEAELKAARAALPAPTNPPPAEAVQSVPKFADFRPLGHKERLEWLKKEDPKRYAEFEKHHAEMRKRQIERTKGKIGYLASIDTSTMSKEEQANHAKLQELLAQRENLPDTMESSDEERRQRHELDRAIREASRNERTTLLKQTASALGLSGEDATVLTETLEDVIRVTDQDRHMMPPGPPPGNGGGHP